MAEPSIVPNFSTRPSQIQAISHKTFTDRRALHRVQRERRGSTTHAYKVNSLCRKARFSGYREGSVLRVEAIPVAVGGVDLVVDAGVEYLLGVLTYRASKSPG